MSRIALPAQFKLSSANGDLDTQFDGDVVLRPDPRTPGRGSAILQQNLPATAITGTVRANVTDTDVLSFQGGMGYGPSISDDWEVVVYVVAANHGLSQIYSRTFQR